MSESRRLWMGPDIQERARVLMIARTVDGSPSVAWLERQLAADSARLHLGLLGGASAYSNPRHLRDAILEAWTRMLIHEARGTLAPEKVLVLEEEIRNVFLLS
jgi:hypothetical protein